MSNTGILLSNLLLTYIRGVKPDANYRLIVPGLTKSLAQEMHNVLLGETINSFFVINEQEKPSESKRWISPVNLTTMRIGSFVAITDIAALSEIRDSIQGTGGVIRSRAFSEEWPWIDNGPEWARFKGPFINQLLAQWTDDNITKNWLNEIIVDELLVDTRDLLNREVLLLEDILGTFHRDLYPAIEGTTAQFLFHCGIPIPADPSQKPKLIARDQANLLKHIRNRISSESDIREQVLDNIETNDPQATELKSALNTLLDGLHLPEASSQHLLAFKNCWGAGALAINNWKLLTYEKLGELFDRPSTSKTKLTAKFHKTSGVIISNDEDGDRAACRLTDPITLDISYAVPTNDFISNATRLKISNNKRILYDQLLTSDNAIIPVTLDIANSNVAYKIQITLRVEIFIGSSPVATKKLWLHCCGENRPTFIVTQPGFYVDDAKPLMDGSAVAKVYSIEDPITLYIFSESNTEPVIYTNDSDSQLPLSTTDGYWYSRNPIDVSAQPRGTYLCRCELDPHFIDLTFESEQSESGEFTLEDELRECIAHATIPRVKEILALHTEGEPLTYTRLGKFTTETQRLSTLAKLFEQPHGHKVILANLLSGSDCAIVDCGPYARKALNLPGIDPLASANLSADALIFVNQYTATRQHMRSCVASHINTDSKASKYPDYALLPLYVDGGSLAQSQTEEALAKYLAAYLEVQQFLLNRSRQLNWAQLFVLTHLDTVVHWDAEQDDNGQGRNETSNLSNGYFLIGPWHPLVLAKRYMVQRALVLRGRRLIKTRATASSKLVELLATISGFNWHPCPKRREAEFEVAYVTPTSDPGWHIAIKKELGDKPAQLADLFKALHAHYGLQATINLPPSSGMIAATLRSYLKTFPSKRHMGIYFPTGFNGAQEIETVDKLIHARDAEEQEKPTTEGHQLNGGINLSFREYPNVPEDTIWSTPPLKVFHFDNFNTCLQTQHPDIQFYLPAKDIQFTESRFNKGVPRGTGYGAVFSQPISRIAEGQDTVPQSIVEEWDQPGEYTNHFGDLFRQACANIGRFSQNALGIRRSIALPTKLDTAWSVIPGTVIDPRVFVKYVSSADNPRALWDYRINLLAGTSSYFVLSQIPQTFRSAVHGIFNSTQDLASEFVKELSKIGLAIAGEAMKSGRHALGTVGVVGAARLFSQITTNRSAAPNRAPTIAFLLPVDSFQEFFTSKNGETSSRLEPDLRGDLLLIQLKLPTRGNPNITIEATAIECKYTTAIYTDPEAASALQQASATEAAFRELCIQARSEDGLPERLALLRLIRFGLRISQNDNEYPLDQNNSEYIIYEKLLSSEFDYVSSNVPFVLVTTEGNSLEPARMIKRDKSVWIRLNPRNWPGVAETESVVTVRNTITETFGVVPTYDKNTGKPQPTDPQSTMELPILAHTTASDDATIKPTTNPITASPQPASNTQFSATAKSGTPIEVENIPLLVSPVPTALSGGQQNVERGQGINLRKMQVGTDVRRHAVYFDPHSQTERLDNVNAMITGSSGKGKTQLLKYLITELRDQGVNTVVFDFKNDFASDLHFIKSAQLNSIAVALHGIPFNPLIPYPIRDRETQQQYIQCGQHIEGISSVFRRTYGLGVQQEAAVRTAIRDAFTHYKIDYGTKLPYSATREYPDFATVGHRLYESNRSAYNRLDPLFTLGLFSPENRGVSFDSMLDKSVTFDMSGIQSEPLKNTLTELMVRSAHSFYNTQTPVGTLRQAFVVDEAHRILKADFMENFARECRSYGVSLILSSQYPTHFPADISGNMATKIIHGNDRDKALVRQIIDLLDCTGHEQEIGGLKMFEAFFSNKHHPNTQIRTITFPHALVLKALQDQGPLTREQITNIQGLDTGKLSVETITRHLQQLGKCQETNGVLELVTN